MIINYNIELTSWIWKESERRKREKRGSWEEHGHSNQQSLISQGIDLGITCLEWKRSIADVQWRVGQERESN